MKLPTDFTALLTAWLTVAATFLTVCVKELAARVTELQTFCTV
jgi:hypothetical protein